MTTVDADLAPFLLARAGDAEREASTEMLEVSTYADIAAGRRQYVPGAPRPADQKLTGEAAMLRGLVEFVQSWQHMMIEDCWYTCAAATEERDGGESCNDAVRGGECDCGRDYRASAVLGLAALPYADHPDYREAWRPRT